VGGDQGGVDGGADLVDRLQQPVGHLAGEVGIGDPGSVVAGGEVGRVVGDPDDRDP
jgi:hypothetical protein